MRKIGYGMVLLAFLAFGSISAKASEVLMVTWQGDLDSEVQFKKKLKELRPDVNFVTIDAKRKKGELAQKLRKIDLSKFDLVYSFGTTGSKLVKDFLKGRKPHLFNVVSTPVLSKIADSIDKPGVNTTGTKFLVDFKTQLEVLTSLRKIKSLAIWYDPREKQGTTVVKALKAGVSGKGIKVKALRIIPDSANFKDLVKTASEEANRMDALYIVATSSFRNHTKSMISNLDPKLLVMSTLVNYVKDGATVALGADLGERGKTAAELANRILGGEKPGNIPVALVTSDKVNLYVNTNKKDAAGLTDVEKMKFNVKLIKQE